VYSPTAKIACWNMRCTHLHYLKRLLAGHRNSDSNIAVPVRLNFLLCFHWTRYLICP
jgi:hypothetical protein